MKTDWDQVWDQVRGQVIIDQAEAECWFLLGRQIEIQVLDRVWVQVWRQVWDQIEGGQNG